MIGPKNWAEIDIREKTITLEIMINTNKCKSYTRVNFLLLSPILLNIVLSFWCFLKYPEYK